MLNLEGKNWAYWLDETAPSPSHSDRFRVSVVIENEPGHRPTGDPEKMQQPWYWDRQTCIDRNLRMGLTPEMAAKIVNSSMRLSLICYGAASTTGSAT